MLFLKTSFIIGGISVEKRKRLSHVLLVLAVFVILAGCGTGNGNGNGNGKDGNSSSSGLETNSKGGNDRNSEQQTVIKFTRWASLDEEKQFGEWIGEFEKSHPHIKVVTEFYPWGPYWDKVKTDLIAGTSADVISFYHGGWLPYSQSDVFVDMNSFDEAKATFAQLLPGALNAYEVEGQQLAAPIGVGRNLFILNKQAFEQANVPLPAQDQAMSAEEWIEVLAKVQESFGGDYKALNIGVTDLALILSSSAGSPLITEDARQIKINTPEGIHALELVKKFYDRGVVVPMEAAAGQGAWGTPNDALLTNKVAVTFTGNHAFTPFKEAGIAFYSVPNPIVAGGSMAGPGFFNGFSIPKSSANQAAAWELIQWMVSKEGNLAFGQFSDMPVNREALEELQAMQDKDEYGGFMVGNENVTNSPPLPSDVSGLLGDLFDKFLKGEITAGQFAEQLEREGQPLLDKFFANLGN